MKYQHFNSHLYINIPSLSDTQTLWCMISVMYDKDINDGGNNEKISACSKVHVDCQCSLCVWGGVGMWRGVDSGGENEIEVTET